MPNKSSSCPDSRAIREFFDGKLDSDLASEISDHLNRCDECAIVAGQMDFVTLPIIQNIKGNHHTSFAPSVLNYDDLIRSQSLFPTNGYTYSNREGSVAENQIATPGISIQAVEPPQMIGRYSIRRLLGRGGMGSVYEAFDGRLERVVAIKFPHQTIQGDELARKRFQQEARTAASVHHPNVCGVLDCDEVDGLCFFTMPLMKGCSLAQRLKSAPQLSLIEVLRIIIQLCHGLDAVHLSGAIHRDIKPSNIFLQDNNETSLLDFGIALASDNRERMTINGSILGTPTYFSPEQAKDDGEPLSSASDIYSVGVVLYEMLTGSPPFTGSPSEVIGHKQHSQIPPLLSHYTECDINLVAICSKALAHKPNDRFSSAKQFANELQGWLDRKALKSNQFVTSKLKPIWAAGSILSLVFAIIFISYTLLPSPPKNEDQAELDQKTMASNSVTAKDDTLNASNVEDGLGADLLNHFSKHSTKSFIEGRKIFSEDNHQSHFGPVTKSLMSPDGTRIALLHQSPAAVTLWSAQDGRSLGSINLAKLDTTIAFLPDSSRIASAGGGWHVRLWDCDSSREIAAIGGHHNWINNVRFNVSSNLGVSISKDKTIRVFDLTSLAHRWDLSIGVWPRALAISADGTQIATGCNDGTIKFWESTTGQSLGSIVASSTAIVDLTYLPNNNLISLDSDGSLVSRDLATSKQAWHKQVYAATSFAFSTDGNLLAAASAEGALDILQSQTGKVIFSIPPHGNNKPLTPIGFSMDGRMLYSTAPDGTICSTILPP